MNRNPSTPGMALKLPLQLTGTVGPLSELTLISQHLTFAYRIHQLTVYFPDGCNHLVHVYPILAADHSLSTSGLPPGTPLLAFLSAPGYITGNAIDLTMDLDYIVRRRGTWLKAHLINTDGFAHTITLLLALTQTTENP